MHICFIARIRTSSGAYGQQHTLEVLRLPKDWVNRAFEVSLGGIANEFVLSTGTSKAASQFHAFEGPNHLTPLVPILLPLRAKAPFKDHVRIGIAEWSDSLNCLCALWPRAVLATVLGKWTRPQGSSA